MNRHEVKNYIRYLVELRAYGTNDEFILNKWDIVARCFVSERLVRKCFSELRAEGYYFFPLGNSLYKLYSGDALVEAAEKFANSVVKSCRTQYFNDLTPILPVIKDEHLRNHIGQVSFMPETKTLKRRTK